MLRRSYVHAILAAGVSLAVTGCMPKMTVEEMKAMMPTKPVELERLNDFVGTWKGKAKMKMAGLDETMEGDGTSKIEWAGDGWYLVEHGEYSMGKLGDMKAIGLWTYDVKSKKYRMAWVDTMGSIATGTAKYDSRKNVWHMKTVAHGPMGTSTGKGTTTFSNKDTMEWTWNEYAMGGLFKTMEMCGKSERQ